VLRLRHLRFPVAFRLGHEETGENHAVNDDYGCEDRVGPTPSGDLAVASRYRIRDPCVEAHTQAAEGISPEPSNYPGANWHANEDARQNLRMSEMLS
jgi:hypothetical protein